MPTLGAGAEAYYADEAAVGSKQLVARVQLIGALVFVLRGVPERVVFGGGEDIAASTPPPNQQADHARPVVEPVENTHMNLRQAVVRDAFADYH
ncbi:hypothetical protein ACFVWG_25595 [Kribbella sp. NPDC058245]|uniref:hypothetical protein n=1 Tax=Kribbella sp. NPDC058245 TaxID=3346399 RepID=UPI0036E77D7F